MTATHALVLCSPTGTPVLPVRPRSSGDRAFASGAKGRRFESCRGHPWHSIGPDPSVGSCASPRVRLRTCVRLPRVDASETIVSVPDRSPTVATVVDDLYSIPPAEFVARRGAYVSQLKKSGDKSGAARVAALRKPTVVAYLVNTLARRDESALAQLFELGARLELAQKRGEGRALRELSAARSRSLHTLVDRALVLGRERGATVNDGVAREITSTLIAALADPEVGRRVRAGLTVVAETYSGFGPALLSLVPDHPDNNSDSEQSTDADADADEDRAHQQEIASAERNRLQAELDAADAESASARRAVEAAHTEARRAASALRSAAEQVARIELELEQARTRVAAAEEAAAAGTDLVESTERACKVACDRVSAAQSALDEYVHDRRGLS